MDGVGKDPMLPPVTTDDPVLVIPEYANIAYRAADASCVEGAAMCVLRKMVA